MTRRLALHRETLTELNPVELTMVVGAGPVPTLPISDCCPSRFTEATCTW